MYGFSPEVVAFDEARGGRTTVEEAVAVEAADDVELVGNDHHPRVVPVVANCEEQITEMSRIMGPGLCESFIIASSRNLWPICQFCNSK